MPTWVPVAIEAWRELERSYPGTTPFLLGLSLAAVLRWFSIRSYALMRAQLIRELRAESALALSELESAPKRKHVNGTAGKGSNGASS